MSVKRDKKKKIQNKLLLLLFCIVSRCVVELPIRLAGHQKTKDTRYDRFEIKLRVD